MTASTTGSKSLLTKAVATIAAIAVWQVASMLISQSLLLVSPATVFLRLLELCVTADFWSAVGYSLLRITIGFFLALIAGTVLGVIAGHVRFVEILLWPYIAVVKATPVASFIILCLMWLGAKGLSMFIAFLMVLPIIYTNVLQGIRSTDHKLLEMTTLFGVRWPRRLYYVHIPSLKPYLISACSVAIGLAWKAGIAAEVIGIPSGSIGERLYEAKVYLSSADLFAWTVVVVLMSVIFEKLFIRILRIGYTNMEKT